MMFQHFDKDKSGKLSHDEFKSCLRALGYDLPVAEEEGEEEPEFDAILAIVDPNKDGSVQLQDYMAFMISKETENVQSFEDVENAFKTITSEREYITKEELYANLTRNMADYCLGKMNGYTDSKTGQEIIEAYDYMEFMQTLFQMNGNSSPK
jgi:spectrin alpha